MADTFEFGIQAKLKHGALLKLVNQFGSNKAAAEALGMRQDRFGLLLNLKLAPPDPMYRSDQWVMDVAKLEQMTGLTEDELFPPPLKNKEFQIVAGQKQSVYKEVPISKMIEASKSFLLPSPEDDAIEHEIDFESIEEMNQALKTLNERSRQILIRRFGLNGNEPESAREIAKQLGVSKERIQQLKTKALRKLKSDIQCRRIKAEAQ